MWETSRTGSGFPLPACSFYCLNALPTETQPSLTFSVFTNSIFPSIIHVSFALYDISLFHLRTSSIKRPFFASAHISEDLSSSAGVHLSASGTSGSSLSHHNIPLCAAAVKCLVVMVTTPRNNGCPADICRAPKACVESGPSGTVLVWTLCSWEIRENDHRMWNRQKRTRALRSRWLHIKRCPFEERLACKIVGKGQVTVPPVHLLSMFLDSGMKRRRPSRCLENLPTAPRKTPDPTSTRCTNTELLRFRITWVWKFWPSDRMEKSHRCHI